MKRLDELFEIKYSKSLELMNCELNNAGMVFVSRTSSNNGVVARIKQVDDLSPMPAHAITVALGGSVLSSFYQNGPFYTSFHIACLYPKSSMEVETMLYYCSVIEKNKYKYHYGRQANKTLKSLLLPSIEELPSYVNSDKLENPFSTEPVLKNHLSLNLEKWRWFRYEELFLIKKGKRLTKEDMIEGNINYIGATNSNNGITAKISNNQHIHQGNTITVSYNGSIAEAFYQEKEFWATDDVNVLYPKLKLNKYIASFICTLIPLEKFRYNFGRKWDKELMKKSLIKLPATNDGEPDWQFMENYIKSLPYSGNI